MSEYGYARLGRSLQRLGKYFNDKAEFGRLERSEAYLGKELLALGDATPAWDPGYLVQAETLINTEVDRHLSERRGIFRETYRDRWAQMRTHYLLQAQNNHRRAAADQAGRSTQKLLTDAVDDLSRKQRTREEVDQAITAHIQGIGGLDAATRETLLEDMRTRLDDAVNEEEFAALYTDQEHFIRFMADAFVDQDTSALDDIFLSAQTIGQSNDLFQRVRNEFVNPADQQIVDRGVTELDANRRRKDAADALIPHLDALEVSLHTTFAEAKTWEDALAAMDGVFEQFHSTVGQQLPGIAESMEEELQLLESEYRGGVEEMRVSQLLPQPLVDLYKTFIDERDVVSFTRALQGHNAMEDFTQAEQVRLDDFASKLLENPVIYGKQLRVDALDAGEAFNEFLGQLPESATPQAIVPLTQQVAEEIERTMDKVREGLPAEVAGHFAGELAALEQQLHQAGTTRMTDLLQAWSAGTDERTVNRLVRFIEEGGSAEQAAQILAQAPTDLGDGPALALQLGAGQEFLEAELVQQSRFYARQPGGFGSNSAGPSGLSGPVRSFLMAFQVGPPTNPYGIEPTDLTLIGDSYHEGIPNWAEDRGMIDAASFAYFNALYQEQFPARDLAADLESKDVARINAIYEFFANQKPFPQFAVQFDGEFYSGVASPETNFYQALAQSTDTLPGFFNLPKYGAIPMADKVAIWEGEKRRADEFSRDLQLDTRRQQTAALGNLGRDLHSGRVGLEALSTFETARGVDLTEAQIENLQFMYAAGQAGRDASAAVLQNAADPRGTALDSETNRLGVNFWFGHQVQGYERVKAGDRQIIDQTLFLAAKTQVVPDEFTQAVQELTGARHDPNALALGYQTYHRLAKTVPDIRSQFDQDTKMNAEYYDLLMRQGHPQPGVAVAEMLKNLEKTRYDLADLRKLATDTLATEFPEGVKGGQNLSEETTYILLNKVLGLGFWSKVTPRNLDMPATDRIRFESMVNHGLMLAAARTGSASNALDMMARHVANSGFGLAPAGSRAVLFQTPRLPASMSEDLLDEYIRQHYTLSLDAVYRLRDHPDGGWFVQTWDTDFDEWLDHDARRKIPMHFDSAAFRQAIAGQGGKPLTREKLEQLLTEQ